MTLLLCLDHPETPSDDDLIDMAAAVSDHLMLFADLNGLCPALVMFAAFCNVVSWDEAVKEEYEGKEECPTRLGAQLAEVHRLLAVNAENKKKAMN